MSAVRDGWRRFWFPVVPVRRLAAFRWIVVGFALYDLLLPSSFIARYSRVDGEFYDPIFVLRVLDVPRASPDVSTALHAMLVVALVLALVGVMTRVWLAVATTLYVWWFATFYSFGALQHGRIMLTFSLVALTAAPAGAAYSVDALIARMRRAQPGLPLPTASNASDELAGWALRFVTVLLAAAYTLSAWAKVKASGLTWLNGDALTSVIVEKGSALGDIVVENPGVAVGLSVAALVLEASAWVVFLPGRVPGLRVRIRDAWLASAAGFHFGSLLLLKINFIPWVVTYAAFFRLERLTAMAGAVARRAGRRTGPRLSVTYDGQCHLCVRTIAVLSGLDWLGRLDLRDAVDNDATVPDAMYVLDDRRRHRGYKAFRRLAWGIPLLWPCLLFAYLPPVVWSGERVYEWVAANRSRTGSCGVQGCALPIGRFAASRDVD